MGVIVDLVDEIRNRIETATEAGKTLADVKRVMVGTEAEARGMKNFPVINISLVGGSIINEYQKGSASDEIEVEILMLYNKLVGTNKQYKTSGGGSGSIYYLEKLLNAIENNTSDVLDFNFSGKASRLRSYRYEIDESKAINEIRLSLTVGTIQFMAGQR